MQAGFPAALLSLLRCPVDGGVLHIDGAAAAITAGQVVCRRCAASYAIRDGVLSLLVPADLNPESALEMERRDHRNGEILGGRREEWRSAMADAIEVRPTLDALDVQRGDVVAELGCGPGRYTEQLAGAAAAVLALDLSRTGLLVLRGRLGTDAPVALVQADVTRCFAAPASIDRALSTLHSNLPDRAHRQACLREVARALRPGGHAVISMHHYSLRDVVGRVPASGRYAENGIYRYLMRAGESRAESHGIFGRVRHAFISANVPGVPGHRVAWAAAKLPLVRAAFGQLFLAICSEPMGGAA